ncbi:amino acid ABC transporter permease [Bauldia sp.]|uniref:amino acid ABC transporter permease n=1 Tax=Bauldia sp. TaxID=2575872 RepID=UPI003BAA3D79
MAVGDMVPEGRTGPPRASLLYDPKVRGIVSQIVVAVSLVAFFWWIIDNTRENLQRLRIASGFNFLWERAGFAISQTLVEYTPESSYAWSFVVGLLNTILVAAIGIVLASIIGFVAGIARLSPNKLISGIAAVYIETLRNAPLLLQLFFWYGAVLTVLPGPRQAVDLPLGANISNRGLILPWPAFEPGAYATAIAVLVALLGAWAIARWARRRQEATGQPFPAFLTGVALVILLPILVFLVTGRPATISYPELQGFNFVGGLNIQPEFVALLLGLSLYTGTFIAEIVRAGILAVSHGQTEAAYALGFRPGPTLRLIIIPQAMRVIIPPLTNQYLNLTKNSSLAVAIGYPDLVSVFSGTVLSQTGQSVETILITMLVYLTLSLLTALFMNWFNARVALVER